MVSIFVCKVSKLKQDYIFSFLLDINKVNLSIEGNESKFTYIHQQPFSQSKPYVFYI